MPTLGSPDARPAAIQSLDAKTVSPAWEPEVEQAINGIALRMKDDIAQLIAARRFLDFVDGIRLQVAPGPSIVMQDAISHLEEFKEVICLAGENPTSMSEPIQCGYVGESTVRARLGIKFLTLSWSGVVYEHLEPLGVECELLRDAAVQSILAFRQIAQALSLCTSRIQQTIECFYAVQRHIQRLAAGGSSRLEAFSALPLRAGLDLRPFMSAVRKLEALPKSLAPVTSAIRKRVEMIQTFAANAPAEVHASFQLPFPASMVQKVILGNEPPMMQSLLHQLGSMRNLRLGEVLDTLDTLTESVAALNTEVAIDPVKEFGEKAHRHLDCLGAVLGKQRLGQSDEVWFKGYGVAFSPGHPEPEPRIPQPKMQAAEPASGGEEDVPPAATVASDRATAVKEMLTASLPSAPECVPEQLKEHCLDNGGQKEGLLKEASIFQQTPRSSSRRSGEVDLIGLRTPQDKKLPPIPALVISSEDVNDDLIDLNTPKKATEPKAGDLAMARGGC